MVLRITITDKELELRLQKLYLKSRAENWSATWNDVIRKLVEGGAKKK